MIKKIIIFFIISLPTVSYPDELRVVFGLWGGKLELELQQRFFLDHLIEGNQLGKIDLNWSGKKPFTIYPLGLEYLISKGNYNIVLFSHLSFTFPNIQYNSIFLNSQNISKTEFQNFRLVGLSDDSGIGFQIKKNGILFSPKFGSQFFRQTFNYNELTIGQISSISLGKNFFNAYSSAYYLGFDLELKLNNNLSFVGEYSNTEAFPIKSGKMEFITNTIVFSGNFTEIQSTNSTSSYNVKSERYKLGLLFDMGGFQHFEFGIRIENQKHSYPSYFNTPFSISINGIRFDFNSIYDELITDIIIYQQEQEQKKGLVYFAFKYHILINQK
ncbi:MAG: hypothetical protein ACK4UJ_08760 [Leptonema sp. (in: bacteria)]